MAMRNKKFPKLIQFEGANLQRENNRKWNNVGGNWQFERLTMTTNYLLI